MCMYIYIYTHMYPVRCARQAATVPKLKIKTASRNIAT